MNLLKNELIFSDIRLEIKTTESLSNQLLLFDHVMFEFIPMKFLPYSEMFMIYEPQQKAL